MFIKETKNPLSIYTEQEFFSKFKKSDDLLTFNEISEILNYNNSYSLYKEISNRNIPVVISRNTNTNRYCYKLHRDYLTEFSRYNLISTKKETCCDYDYENCDSSIGFHANQEEPNVYEGINSSITDLIQKLEDIKILLDHIKKNVEYLKSL